MLLDIVFPFLFNLLLCLLLHITFSFI